MRILLGLAACALAAVATATADAGKGGPSPGVMTGWNGVASADGKTRFVALTGARTTTVASVRVRGGAVTRYSTLAGTFGVPLVAFDGSTAGLSHDGRVLVLASASTAVGRGAVSRFAVIATRNLRTRTVVTLRGSWSFDALSPDGSTLYLVEYLNSADAPGYRVRAYDLERRMLLRGAVIDARAPDEAMAGQPVTRANGPGGAWAYTLYRKPGGFPFVHALDTVGRRALCIGLPWRERQDALWSVRLSASPDGRLLSLRQRGKPLAAIDLRSLSIRTFRQPAV